MPERRVVITGTGIVSSLGIGFDSFWKNLREGRSGISLVESMNTDEYTCKIAGEVKPDDFDAEAWFSNPKEVKRTDRFTQFGIAASKMAIDMSGLAEGRLDPNRVGVMVGSGIGGLHTLEAQYSTCLERGPGRISPFTIPMLIANIASGMVSMEYDFRGPNMAIVTACATANNSIGEAWRMIQFGDADAFVCGGTEATICPMGLGGFGKMRALSTRNDDPEAASRPFDVGRDGFVMGEGAGVIVIETLEHAEARGAEILAELRGYGVSADAHHLTAPDPDGEGAARCMDMALGHAGLNPGDIDYINAHGTSTPQGDICESKAIKKSFGDHAHGDLVVSSTKSMTGHLLGAAGGVETAACIAAVRDGVIPPTINLDDQDPECDLDYCANEAREAVLTHALTNSFGFGGHNASLIISRFS